MDSACFSQVSSVVKGASLPPGGSASRWALDPGVVPGKGSQVPTVDVLRDLQRLKGKRLGVGQICNQGQRASPGQG